jgi:calcium-translocating P-type ATPase
MLKVLLVAGLVSIATGVYLHPSHGWIEGFAILICVAIVLFVGAFQNHKQEVEYRKLAASLKGAPSTVIRGGKTQNVEQECLLVGDIVILNPGNMIPADGIIIDNTTVKVNESALTGESDEKSKNIKDPFMAAGTELVDGSCSMLVTATGVNSAKGKLMANLATAPESTDLQKRLERSEKLAGYLGLCCGVFCFTALLIKFAVGKPDWKEDWSKIIQFFITSISIVLCSIPEGLPLAVTISMAYSMQRMRDDQNLVKVLSACETMGNVTTICSDKTGTLTTNQMTLVQAFIGQRYFARQPEAHELSTSVHKHLIDGIILNSDKRDEKMV